MDSENLFTRISIVETKLAVLDTKLLMFEKTQAQILEQLKELNTNVTRYKGFFGGITFILSSLGIFVVSIKDWLINHFK